MNIEQIEVKITIAQLNRLLTRIDDLEFAIKKLEQELQHTYKAKCYICGNTAMPLKHYCDSCIVDIYAG